MTHSLFVCLFFSRILHSDGGCAHDAQRSKSAFALDRSVILQFMLFVLFVAENYLLSSLAGL
jgi:hypothetical protein